MLDKKYNHKEVEEGKYENWKNHGYFNSGDMSLKPYAIVIPPPNVTGKLHLGHAWDTTIQDILIRYKRMDGYDTLWLPGMDHAAIATEAKVVKKLKGEGIDKYEYGRENFLKACWDWTNEYGGNIRDQWAKLGLSVDYTKERFTLDDGLSNAVRKCFVDMYNEGLIYRGERIINWDPQALTALSNEEVIYKDVEGAFYHIKYFIEGTNDYLEVATTRPETMFGDTAVAVNPSDERYNNLIGKNVILPIVNKLIPIVGDLHADPEFGTGVVKITPAHDPNDFEVGNRHNLERIVVMNPNGTMNENAGIYNGLDRFACREKLVEDLKNQDLLISIEKITHSVGHSERTDVMVEPYLSKQWFVKMRGLADRVLENQKDRDNKVNFVPERYEKTMNHWMEITYDWCISRQLWWGHQIPAWYKDDQIYVGMEAPKEEGWVQDPDVLDTWFSSALWPFSTMGWPDKTVMMERYFPNDVLVTGYDIIPFWVNRMTFQSLHLTGKRPFKDVIIHGLIRDKQGRKMSKSLGNGVDPMDVIDEYGCDALRFFLTTSVAPGMDLRYDEEKVKSTWNFINKLWNASRYVLMTTENLDEKELSNIDKWILTKTNELIKKVRKHLDSYDFNVVGTEIYNFIWSSFCDNYIELSKISPNKEVLLYVLETIVKLIHPFMPYVTEEIYQMLPNHDESIMISSYPKYDSSKMYDKECEEINKLIDIITNIRNARQQTNMRKDYVIINMLSDDNKCIIDNNKDVVEKLTKATFVDEISSDFKKLEVITSYGKLICGYKGNDNVDIDALNKEIESLKNSIERRKKLLSNEGYVNKAPKNLVEEERSKLDEEIKKLESLINKLNS